MGWFGEENMIPILSSGNAEDRKAGAALRKQGLDTFAVKGLWCSECGRDDGAHAPNGPCEGVN